LEKLEVCISPDMCLIHVRPNNKVIPWSEDFVWHRSTMPNLFE